MPALPTDSLITCGSSISKRSCIASGAAIAVDIRSRCKCARVIERFGKPSRSRARMRESPCSG
jgi:hypothetical protein